MDTQRCLSWRTTNLMPSLTHCVPAGRYHVYACGDYIDYSSDPNIDFSTPILLDSLRLTIRKEPSHQNTNASDVFSLILPASAFGFFCYIFIATIRCRHLNSLFDLMSITRNILVHFDLPDVLQLTRDLYNHQSSQLASLLAV